jgi:hypothetical protein
MPLTSLVQHSGALVAGYALIPAVGKNSATYIAALLSLLVALYALEKQKSADPGVVQEQPSPLKLRPPPVALGVGVAALTILAVGGAVTLGLEVVYMHMLAVVAGNSVYAFGLMLATFLLGLGLGSATGERAITSLGRERVVILAQWGLACAIVISSLQWDALAGYFAYFGPYEASGIHITFSGRELIRALVCAVAMLPPAFFIGMSYPACMGLATDWLGRNGEDVSGSGEGQRSQHTRQHCGCAPRGFLAFAGIRLTQHPAVLHFGRFVDWFVDGGAPCLRTLGQKGLFLDRVGDWALLLHAPAAWRCFSLRAGISTNCLKVRTFIFILRNGGA